MPIGWKFKGVIKFLKISQGGKDLQRLRTTGIKWYNQPPNPLNRSSRTSNALNAKHFAQKITQLKDFKAQVHYPAPSESALVYPSSNTGRLHPDRLPLPHDNLVAPGALQGNWEHECGERERESLPEKVRERMLVWLPVFSKNEESKKKIVVLTSISCASLPYNNIDEHTHTCM